MKKESDVEAHKRECLERWRVRKPRRRKLALRIMLGREEIDPNWPLWVVRDIEAEIALIKREREQDSRRHREREERIRIKEERERADKDWLL